MSVSFSYSTLALVSFLLGFSSVIFTWAYRHICRAHGETLERLERDQRDLADFQDFVSHVIARGPEEIERMVLRRRFPSERERPFVDKILEDLSDDFARDVFADWLEERGDCEKAKVMRSQAAGIRERKANLLLTGLPGANPKLSFPPRMVLQ